ncbi:hypothetical protein QYE47_23195 [Pseudomonas sp. 2,4-D]|uniref:hypothetical protein n=1 Tax=Pseudomonas sp. 2,4-D TaxID=3058433 RepID=UPI00260301AB|nr:hypothetical protein [Pseudomonas sp. 2,4-D]MDN4515431.1 hypothetical protein [Pseudomonas sp. 2,4-D]
MMAVHPLFSGFSGAPIGRLGRALGFELLAEARPGRLPHRLSFVDTDRMREGGDLAGYRFAGGWEAGNLHCLLFAKPVTYTAERLWSAALPRPE